MNEENWKPEKLDDVTNYIICPDLECSGFVEERIRCTNMLENKCPRYNEAKKILFCYRGHPNILKVDESAWKRMDCSHDGCYASSFSLASGEYWRIPLNKLEEFLKIPFKEK
jgi:hypothetical protein